MDLVIWMPLPEWPTDTSLLKEMKLDRRRPTVMLFCTPASPWPRLMLTLLVAWQAADSRQRAAMVVSAFVGMQSCSMCKPAICRQ
jgi:hypothetical protein